MKALDLDFKKLINLLKKKGKMLINPFNYHTLIAYISGYTHRNMELKNSSPLDGFTEWLDLKIGYHCSLNWAYVILDLFANSDEENAIEKFFEFYEEFINECEKNGVESIIERSKML